MGLDWESYSDLGKLGRLWSLSKLWPLPHCTKVAATAVVDLSPMSIIVQMATDKEGRVGDPYQDLPEFFEKKPEYLTTSNAHHHWECSAAVQDYQPQGTENLSVGHRRGRQATESWMTPVQWSSPVSGTQPCSSMEEPLGTALMTWVTSFQAILFFKLQRTGSIFKHR